MRWYRLAAVQGYAHAQLGLGSLLDYGWGDIPQDYAEAAYWYRLAAEQGCADAQYELAYLFEHGLGVPLDYAEAAHWYLRSR
jgi:hypothetical protein